MSRVLPILFNTDMVQAILDGRKTVTRRICKDGNDYVVPDMSFYNANKRTYAVHNYANKEHTEKLSLAERTCPVCPGDILYVRETWSFMACIECDGKYARGHQPCYDFQAVEYDDGDSISDGCFLYKADCKTPERISWRPSIHMPKRAARIWLKVTDVRVEKLQDIINEQILKEGISQATVEHYMAQFPEATEEWVHAAHWLPYSDLWNSTIKKKDFGIYGWDANPWVWVIEFERCEKPEGM